MALSHKDYLENGFAIARDIFTEEEVVNLKNRLHHYLQHVVSAADPGEIFYEDTPRRSLRCVFNIHKRCDYFRELMGEPRLIELVQDVLETTEIVQDGVMLIDKAPFASYEFPFHQDNAYQFWKPPEAVAVTLALDEATPENGTIICLKGSHKLKVLPHHPSGVSGASLSLIDPPDIDQYPEVPLCMRPGDVSLHHAKVIHRSGPNRTSKHRRNLGFAYHSSHAKRDRKAYARFKQYIERIHEQGAQKSSK